MKNEHKLDLLKRLLAEEGPAYRMDLSYVGRSFQGFQAQSSKKTIQDSLEAALKILLGHPTRVRGASRTDSGVHAQHQVALFRTKKKFDPRWLFSLNALTPESIGIQSVQACPFDFDPIEDSQGKAYRYRLWQGKCFNPFVRDYVWPVSHRFNVAALAQEAQSFVGFHDFTAFCNKDSDAKTTKRRIFEVHVEQKGPLLDLWFSGAGFLKQMIRIMVGTLVAIEKGHLPTGTVQALLAKAEERKLAGMTAPPQGLSLVKVFYREIPKISSLLEEAKDSYSLSLYDDHEYILGGGKKSD